MDQTTLENLRRIVEEEAQLLQATQNAQHAALPARLPGASAAPINKKWLVQTPWPTIKAHDEFHTGPDNLPPGTQPVPHLRQFLACSDHDFVQLAYQALLKREADPEGLNTTLGQLRQGVSRHLLLVALSNSPEGQTHRVCIEGLHWARLYYRLLRLPVVPRFLHPFITRFEARQTARVRNHPANQLARSMASVRGFLDQFQAKVTGSLGELTEQGDLLAQHIDQLQAQQAEQARQFSGFTKQLRYIEAAIATHADHSEAQAQTQAQTQTPSLAVPPLQLDAFYVAFEDACRGSQEEITAKQQAYLPLFENLPSPRVVDVGCGRGEWLALLAQQGLQPVGLDINTVMVQHCQSQGLQAESTPFPQWFAQQADASLGAVTAFHVAEHLPFDLLFLLFQQARRVLAPGGVLLLETPNPENLMVGSHTFYHDPTHRNPLTPTLMQFCAQYHGFSNVEIRRLSPCPSEAQVPGHDLLTQRVNGLLTGPQDFALIARA